MVGVSPRRQGARGAPDQGARRTVDRGNRVLAGRHRAVRAGRRGRDRSAAGTSRVRAVHDATGGRPARGADKRRPAVRGCGRITPRRNTGIHGAAAAQCSPGQLQHHPGQCLGAGIVAGPADRGRRPGGGAGCGEGVSEHRAGSCRATGAAPSPGAGRTARAGPTARTYGARAGPEPGASTISRTRTAGAHSARPRPGATGAEPGAARPGPDAVPTDSTRSRPSAVSTHVGRCRVGGGLLSAHGRPGSSRLRRPGPAIKELS